MTDPTQPPEIPYPFPPLREEPRRTGPVMVPVVDMPSSDPARTLRDRRTLMVSGRLDHDAVTELCAELMALDGRSRDDVTLIVNSTGGPVDAVTALLDVLDLMRARVDVTCIGAAQGTAAVVLARATGERAAGRHARISLRVESVDLGPGTPDEVARLAAEHAATLQRIAEMLAGTTGQPADVVLGELRSGVPRGAEDARSFGLVDTVVERG
jgi:ATP-dependent Clp protease protease subunit